MSTKPLAFDPAAWAESSIIQAQTTSHLANNDLEGALTVAFSLPGPPDPYVYQAIAAVTLTQAQRAVSLGRANGLHRWYLKAPSAPSPAGSTVPPTEENDLGNPPSADIVAYVALFIPTAAPSKALTGLVSNAKRDSLRASVGAYLQSKRFLDTDLLGGAPGRNRAGDHFNPALEFWAWSCGALEWAGPCEASTRSHIAHPTLPVFMHLFGCVAPSYEALELIRLVVERRRRKLESAAATSAATAGQVEANNPIGADGEEDDVEDDKANPPAAGEEPPSGDFNKSNEPSNPDAEPEASKKKKKKKKKSKGAKGKDGSGRRVVEVCDIGSGGGYWSWALRRHGLRVHAVDSGQSEFRAMWVPDTVHEDGARWLKAKQPGAAATSTTTTTPADDGGSAGSATGGAGGAADDVLLLVYPVVGADFTRAMLREYRGRDVVVAGTQNANGYTGFKDMTMDEFMRREKPGWSKVAQIALPSFAGKDEALFVYSLD